MRTLISRVSLCAGLALAGAAQAQVPWGGGMASGSASFFDWANGHNSNSNLFGTPTLVGSTFYFFPSNFVAASQNGAAMPGFLEHATDTLEVDLIVHAGLQIDGISVQEYGDYSINNSVNGPTHVDCTGVVNISDGAHGSLAPQPVDFGGVFPASAGTNQSWGGSGLVDLAAVQFGTPFTTIHLSITNDLVAVSVPGTSAVIRKTIVGGTMAITVLPEPGVLGMLGMAGLVAMRRRRS